MTRVLRLGTLCMVLVAAFGLAFAGEGKRERPDKGPKPDRPAKQRDGAADRAANKLRENAPPEIQAIIDKKARGEELTP
ncbi:MAG TPA: hypothetical protein VM186_05430, partial [Planctomycetota bacterium]|nr:hypothetical protein [Planctomycetota bacterium]